MSDPQGNSAEGEREKDEAFGRFEAHRKRLLLLGRRALITHALQHGTATADDVRLQIQIPAGINPKALGAVPSALVKLGIIRVCGFRRTTRVEGHARPVMVWQIKDADAARQWLSDHPDPLQQAES